MVTKVEGTFNRNAAWMLRETELNTSNLGYCYG